MSRPPRPRGRHPLPFSLVVPVLLPALLPVLLAGLLGSAGPASAVLPVPDQEGAAVRTAPARHPAITKVLTFVVENHSLEQMQDSMPYVYRLARRYAYGDRYRAITHPSLPNYLAMVSGSTRGVTDDGDPSQHPLDGLTVFDQALGLDRTATVYADGMTHRCQLTDQGRYAVRHNPWTYFVAGRASCRRHDVPIRRLASDTRAGRLPDVGMVVPDLVHDAHDAPLGRADTWLARQIALVRSGPDWRSGHLAIVVTADEDDYSGDNAVLTVVASRYQPHLVVHAPLTHYSLAGLYSDVLGATPLGEAAAAASMADAFRMTLPSRG